MKQQIGPTLERSEEFFRCGLCIHHARVMRRSGRDPIIEHHCVYPRTAPLLASMGDVADSQYIGTDDVTPLWLCPVYLEKQQVTE